jgi:hypothetical protein
VTTAERSDSIEAVVSRLERVLDTLKEGDANRHFLSTYLRTTMAVQDAVLAGRFADPEWVERLDVAFAQLYLDAIETYQAGGDPSGPWQVAFTAAGLDGSLPPLRHVLLGINAHINYDLPRALLEVMTDADFDDPEVIAARKRDHEVIDSVLSARVAAEDAELKEASGAVGRVDELLAPLNRLASKRFLKEARGKVWDNTIALSAARRAGTAALASRLEDLSRLSAAKLQQLVAPGEVLLKLAVTGFGVRLDASTPKRNSRRRPADKSRSFDPTRVGTLERDAWVAYYQRRWSRVIVLCVLLVRSGFRMGPLSTLRGSWYMLRAGQRWSPYPDNDPAGTLVQLERFYRLVTENSSLAFDPTETARLEMEWWRVHRAYQRFPNHGGYTEADIAAAVADLYEYAYGVPRGNLMVAAQERTAAMVMSDRWVEEGCSNDSPYLAAEGAALVRSYASLLAAVHR